MTRQQYDTQRATVRQDEATVQSNQAQIDAASGLLPKQLPNPPTYKKVNPADKPVFILGLTSDVMTLHQLNQYADLNIAQRISMLPGVGHVMIFGEQKYAPTIQLNPDAMAARGIGMDDVATAVANDAVELPIGSLQGTQQAYQIGANSQLLNVSQLSKVIIAYRNGVPVRIKDVGRVVDGSDAPLQLDCKQSHRRDDRDLAPAGFEHIAARRPHQGDAAAPPPRRAFRRRPSSRSSATGHCRSAPDLPTLN